MYVTGGQYKGRKVVIPDCAKPTLSKVRQGVFNTLFSFFEDFRGLLFLDMFSGSGIMGLEALSRGFDVICIEKNPKAFRIIKENFQNTNENYKIINTDAFLFPLKQDIKPNVVYIDPPWDSDYEKIIQVAAKYFENSILIVEQDKKRGEYLSAKECAKNISPLKEKIYGRCKLDFFEVLHL